MTPCRDKSICLPPAEEIRRAVLLYLEHAYDGEPPETVRRLIPSADVDPARWLMSDCTERDPADALLEGVRSFALRLGNRAYPHMKLRLSRPPNEPVFLLSVDSHDAFLSAPAGSPDAQGVEELKRGNARIAAAIHGAWDREGLLTDRTYLRRKIQEAKARGGLGRTQEPPAAEGP